MNGTIVNVNVMMSPPEFFRI